MILWSFQSSQAIHILKSEGALRAHWSRYSPKDSFTRAYRWMTTQMQARGVSCETHAPIWAWHTCENGGPPTLGTASNLLSTLQLEQGVFTIEFDCPETHAILSVYSHWNDIIYAFQDHGNQTVINDKLMEAVFHADPAIVDPWDAIQATLPYLDLSWVCDIRPLLLPPDHTAKDLDVRV